MQYYRSTATGKILTENALKVLNDVFGNDTIPSMMSDGLLVTVENPSVIDCIRSGNMVSAFARYREIHGGTMEDAKKAIYMIRADISRTQGIYKRRKKKAERAEEFNKKLSSIPEVEPDEIDKMMIARAADAN